MNCELSFCIWLFREIYKVTDILATSDAVWITRETTRTRCHLSYECLLTRQIWSPYSCSVVFSTILGIFQPGVTGTWTDGDMCKVS